MFDINAARRGRVWLSLRSLALACAVACALGLGVARAAQTITFDNVPSTEPMSELDGQYPQGLIEWGSGQWWLSGPWQALSDNSVSFNGDALNSASFSFVSPHQLSSLDAYNGGDAAATVTLSCPGQSDQNFQLGAGEIRTLKTGWSGNCSSVTISTSNGWWTNFENFVIQ